MLAPELLSQIKVLQLKAGHLVTDSLAGEYSSAFKGVGMEFDKVREYTPGDDVRSIDWNVTARMGSPYVKVFREERELTLMLLLDVSPSQKFGSQGRSKKQVAAELAAVLAFLATKNNDKVGLIVFSDHVEEYIAPKKGRAHVWRIIRAILTHEGSGRSTQISTGLETLLRVCKRKSTAFLISDFCSSSYEKALRHASRRHDLTCVAVVDPREQELSNSGFVEFEDAETGERLLLDSSDPALRKAFEMQGQQSARALQQLCAKLKVDHFELNTKESVVTPLLHYIRRRDRGVQR